jgi:protein phosphatase 1 regulatory subunit 3A/B/C/D/E
MDLAEIRRILESEKAPRVQNESETTVPKEPKTKYLAALFALPASSSAISKRVNQNKVALDSIHISGLTVTGVVKVANVTFEKSVTIRYTTNDWRSYKEIRADYVGNLSNGEIDGFRFQITLPPTMPFLTLCQFAIRYDILGSAHWDNNGGEDYSLECRNLDTSHLRSLSISTLSVLQKDIPAWFHCL